MFGQVQSGDMDAKTVGVIALRCWPDASVRIGEEVAVVPLERSCQCFDTDNCPVCAETHRRVASVMKQSGPRHHDIWDAIEDLIGSVELALKDSGVPPEVQKRVLDEVKDYAVNSYGD